DLEVEGLEVEEAGPGEVVGDLEVAVGDIGDRVQLRGVDVVAQPDAVDAEGGVGGVDAGEDDIDVRVDVLDSVGEVHHAVLADGRGEGELGGAGLHAAADAGRALGQETIGVGERRGGELGVDVGDVRARHRGVVGEGERRVDLVGVVV